MEEEVTNPFDPQHTGAVQLIVQMRIYDTLMAILTHLDKDGARDLHELHAQGKLLGALPFLDL